MMDVESTSLKFIGKSKVLDNILQRDAERRSKIQEKKDDVDTTSEILYFRETFKSKESELMKELESCENLKKEELLKLYQRVMADINTLHKFVSSSIFLSQYDLKMAKNSLQHLEEMCKASEEKYIPRKKFGFKNKLKKFDAVDSADCRLKKTADIVVVKREGVGFWDRSNETLFLNSSETTDQDVTLANLDSCLVVLRGTPNTVYINAISNCKLLMGPIKTSVLMYTCKNSVIVAMCQQMRIHRTTETDFYIHVTTRAIIEDCKDVRFAPYTYNYPGLDVERVKSGLNEASNNWNIIDDFNWLSVSKPSPNWCLIPEEERIDSWPYSVENN